MSSKFIRKAAAAACQVAFEPLESRQLFSLLGIPYLGVIPTVDSAGLGGVTYTPNGAFTATSTDMSLLYKSGSTVTLDDIVAPSGGSAQSVVQITVSNLGNLLGSGTGSADLTVQGEVKTLGGTVVTNGVLLTGTIDAFGYQFTNNTANPSQSLGDFDFRFKATGGLLDTGTNTNYFGGNDIGMNFSALNSTLFAPNPFQNGFTLTQPKAFVVPVTPWTVKTNIQDAAGGTPTGILGEQIEDSATVSGSYTPGGTVTYNFYNVANPVYGTTTPISSQTVTIANGLVPNSNATAGLAAGSYTYIAVYNETGGTSLGSVIGSPEPITITQGTSNVSTTIHDSGGGLVTGNLGEEVYDTATVTPNPNAAVPTGTVTYYLYANSSPVYGTDTPISTQTVTLTNTGSVPNSSDTAPLTAGSYGYIAVYSGDSNYSGFVGAVEPLTVNQSNSSVSTTIMDVDGGPVTNTPGESVYDTATVSGSPIKPTGTVTYNFYDTSSPVYGTTTPVSTQTVGLSGGGSGIQNIAISSMVAGPLGAGSYSYIAVYSGDSNYAGSVGLVEPLTINLVTPSINTTQQPATAVVGSSIADQATVSGGYNPTGTVTFNLYNNATATGPALFSDTESLSGGVATSAGYTAAATGTDYWVATYNGDSNNNSVTSLATSEPVIITPSTPSINTTQQPATAVVGSSIADQATVSGGYNPTGTVTFNLYNNATATGPALFTDTESLSGGVATSAGYTATATGTDYWVATYNGDSNNNSVTSLATSEPVIVTPATPSINTQQQPATAVVGSSVADKATVTGGYSPTGTVTFSLYNNSGGTGTPLFTDANEPLVGGVATSAGYTATATGTDYWVATYNGDSNNNSVTSLAASEPVIVTPSTPSINTTQQPATAVVGSSIADQATVSGGYNPTGTVTFNLYNNATATGPALFTDTESLSGGVATSAGYTATATATDYWVATYNGDSNNNSVTSLATSEPVTVTPSTPSINTQQQPATAVVGSSVADKATVSGGYSPTGTVTFSLYNNSAGTGTPLFTDANEPLVGGIATSKGYTATATGTDYWVATYNGDSNNNSVTSLAASEPVIITPSTPSINTTQQPATAVVGSSVADKATVTGGYGPTGTVTFSLYNNSAGTGTPLFVDSNEPLVGGVATSTGYTATATGTDYWVATYNGDSNNNSVTSLAASEPVSITPSTPSIDTQQQPATAVVGSSVADKATVTGGYGPTGTVTFSLYSNSAGTGTPLFVDSNEPLVGGVATSTGYTATATGTDYWVATYNGDSNNNSVTSGASLEPVVITPSTPSINTTQQPATAVVGSSVADKATVTGGYSPTGTVTFSLYNNSAGTGTPLFTDANEPLVSGIATSKGYTATATGTDYWVATYNGDSNNNSVTSLAASEPVIITPSTPSINTQQQPATAVVGSSVADKATVTGGYSPTGTVTFSLYNNSAGTGTPLFTDANEPLVSGIATSKGYTATATGTDYWVATYNGDSNNNSVTSLAASEPVIITPSTPSINTTQQPATAVVGSSVADKATVTGGYSPTGTVTFSLYSNSAGTGTPLFTDANEPLVSGIATSKGYTATATGTDYWVATYNGDSNNSSVTSLAASEPVIITPSTPSINTQQQPATAVVGSSVADKATVTGGYSPTGTVTFSLYSNSAGTGTPLFTDANEPLVSGIATSKGYTATATGTDYWVATYNGDSNNSSVTSLAASEPVIITPSTPSINTQQQPATAVVGSSVADKATVTGGYSPTGTVTFSLYNNSAGTGTPLFTDANEPLVSGIATSKGYTATATGTDYWVATYNGDSNNNSVTSLAASEPVIITPSTPSINTQQQPATAVVGSSVADKATVTGGYSPTGTVTFSLYNNSAGTGTPLFTDANEPLVGGIATSKGYTATATGTDYWVATYNGDSNNNSVTSLAASEPVIITPSTPSINTQQQPATAVVGSSVADKATVTGGYSPTGTVTFSLYSNSAGTGTPLFTDANEPLVSGIATSKGYTATATGTDYWVATYNGDSNNNSVTSLAASEPVIITPSTPSINTTQQPATAVVGSSVADKATVTGGYSPTGTVTFKLYNNSTASGTPLFTDANEPLVSGVATSKGYTATATGTDYWVATYNGDSNNNSVTSGASLEPVVLTPAGPSINTQQQPATAVVGSSVADKATVSGGYSPTGTVTFNLYNNSTGTGTPLFTDTETLSGGIATSKGYTATATGTDYWVATYNGDSNNNAVTSSTTSEPVSITPAGPSIVTTPGRTSTTTGSGQFATIGFWHNQNGQAVITNFDSGANSTLLGNSLAAGYPNLFGTANIYGGKNLAGLTNSQVAADYLNLWTPSGVQKNTYVQAFAVALGAYEGGSVSFNVGSNGAAFGVANSTTLTISQILQSANSNFNPTTGIFYAGNSTQTSDANNVLDGINTSGETPGGSTIVSTVTELTDSATLSGGQNPSGTIKFYLMAPGSTVSTPLTSAVYVDTVTVTGNGGYSTSMGTNPGGYIPTAVGTYQWVAVYSGDSNNSTVTSPFGSEPEVVGQQTPNIFTVPSTTAVTLGSSTITLKDTATLQDGTSPSGSITWTLYLGNTLLDTESTPVSGNGVYTTPTGYTVPATGSVTGTYQWNAGYSGDTKNLATSDLNDPLEQVVVSPAAPGITTTQQPATATVGASVADKATVTGGYSPTGTVTFSLYNNSAGTGTPLFTDTETLSGGVATSKGYTTTAAGTDYWVATYNGDSNNGSVTSPAASEPVCINMASSSISTAIHDSSGGAVTDAMGETVYDTANITSVAGVMPTGTVTYYFYNTSSPVYGTTTPFSTQTVTLSGGAVPISNTSAALSTGSYSYIAVYSGDTNYKGSTGAIEPLSIGKSGSSVSTIFYDCSGGNVTGALGEAVYDTATVLGNGAVTPTGTVTYYCYTTTTPVYGTTSPAGSQTVTLSNGVVPNSMTTPALPAGSYSVIAVYSGDGNYSGSVGAVEPLTIAQGSSNVSTNILDCSGGAVTDALGEKVYDTATVTGSPFTPTGTVTYYFYNTTTPTFGTTTPVSTQAVTLSSSGSVPNSATTAALAAGGDAYIAVYSGDTNYAGYTGAVEPLTISKITPGISTTIKDCGGGAITQIVGEKVYDTSIITGTAGVTATGTVTYYFYNTSSPVYGKTTPTTTQTVTISSGAVPNSATTAALAAGSDAYIAVYSGDVNYSTAVGAPEPLTIGKHAATVCTTIKDSGNCTITDALGEKVYDTASVTGVSGTTPTGSVTYYFYNTASPVYGTTTPTSTQTVTLSSGSVPNSATTAALAAGGYAYIAVYSGDTNYSGAVGSVEPLSINKGCSSISTCIVDSSGSSCNNEVNEKVYDTAKVSASPLTATGTVTYYFYNTSSPTYGKTTPLTTQTVTISSGSVPNSALTSSLAAGSYSYIAVYSGDTNYNGSIGCVEALQISTNCISGHVCKDTCGNGYNCNEQGLQGCQVQLWCNNQCVQTCTTDSSGCYSFNGIGAGCYSVKEVCGSGWTQTCGNNGFTCTATAGQCFNTCNFSNFQNCSIGGNTYQCSGNNWNGNQSGWGGCTVQLWCGNTCVATCNSGSNGSYCFNNVGPGCYTVKQVTQNNCYISNGCNGYTWNTCNGQSYNNCNFSNW